MFDERQVLNEMSTPIRKQIIIFDTFRYFKSTNIFDDVSENFLLQIGGDLEFCVYLTGDVSFKTLIYLL